MQKLKLESQWTAPKLKAIELIDMYRRRPAFLCKCEFILERSNDEARSIYLRILTAFATLIYEIMLANNTCIALDSAMMEQQSSSQENNSWISIPDPAGKNPKSTQWGWRISATVQYLSTWAQLYIFPHSGMMNCDPRTTGYWLYVGDCPKELGCCDDGSDGPKGCSSWAFRSSTVVRIWPTREQFKFWRYLAALFRLWSLTKFSCTYYIDDVIE